MDVLSVPGTELQEVGLQSPMDYQNQCWTPHQVLNRCGFFFWLSAESPMARWNEDTPEHAVGIHDRIRAVNGTTGAPEERPLVG